jgi:hypothetical protein
MLVRPVSRESELVAQHAGVLEFCGVRIERSTEDLSHSFQSI